MGIKGHVAIELKNVETGKVERVEDNNMVTKRLEQFLEVIASYPNCDSLCSQSSTSHEYKNALNAFIPIARSALGGLIIFNTPQAQTDYPEYNPIEVVAKVGNNPSTDPNKGTYNVEESGATETGYRHVWDFSTSQCNTTIASIALTSQGACRQTSETIASYRNSNINSNEDSSSVKFTLVRSWDAIFTAYAASTKSFKGFKITFPEYQSSSSLQSNTKVRVETFSQPICINSFKLNDALWSTKYQVIDSNEQQNLDLPYNFVYGTGESDHYVTDTIGLSSYVSMDAPHGYCYVHVLRTDKHTLNLWTINLTNYSIAFNTLVLPYTVESQEIPMKINGGYIYTFEANNVVRRVNLSNLAQYEDVSSVFSGVYDSSASQKIVSYDKNVLAFIASNSKLRSQKLFDLRTQRAGLFTENRQVLQSTYLFDGLFAQYAKYFYHDSSYVYLREDYLGTIFNLPSPITKTAAQTMKIIYTLTDA